MTLADTNTHERDTKKNTLKNVEKHLLSQFVNTIQSNLSTECLQNQFLFLTDCTSKHVRGPNCKLYIRASMAS